MDSSLRIEDIPAEQRCPACRGRGRRTRIFRGLLNAIIADLILFVVVSLLEDMVAGLMMGSVFLILLPALFIGYRYPCRKCQGTGRIALRRCERCGQHDVRPGGYCATCGAKAIENPGAR